MKFAILGPFEIDRTVGVRSSKQLTILALLLCRANQCLPAAALQDALWRGQPPRTAAKNIHVYVHRVRRLLDDPNRIEFRPPGYRLRVDPGELDVEVFEALLAKGRQALAAGDAAAASGCLERALSLWRGPALYGFEEVESLRVEGTRLEELRLAALEHYLFAELHLGRSAAYVAELTALVARYPYHEGLRALHMMSLYGAGRRAEALAAYRLTRDTFVQELGLEPGPVLCRLEHAMLTSPDSADHFRHLLALVAGGARAAAPALASSWW
jgi:DNA-binding SARP family transcriptional activator